MVATQTFKGRRLGPVDSNGEKDKQTKIEKRSFSMAINLVENPGWVFEIGILEREMSHIQWRV